MSDLIRAGFLLNLTNPGLNTNETHNILQNTDQGSCFSPYIIIIIIPISISAYVHRRTLHLLKYYNQVRTGYSYRAVTKIFKGALIFVILYFRLRSNILQVKES